MPFIAACQFCSGKIRAPDRAMGSSVTCPRCGSAFTLVPMDNPPSEGVLVAPSPSAAIQKRAAEPARVTPETPIPEPNQRKRLDPLGPASLFFGSAGLVLASVPGLHSGMVPLAAVGLIGGLVGWVVALQRENRGLIWSISGSIVSAMVLVIGLFWPGLIRDIWPTPSKTNQSQMMSVPFGKKVEDDKQSSDPDWVDARNRAISQGDMRVRVVSVSLRPAKFLNFDPPRTTNDFYLHIALRIYNVGAERRLPYRTWAELTAEQDRSRWSLRDSSGKQYRMATFDAQAILAGRTRSAEVPPGNNIDDVLIFEPPSGAVDHLRLALPADRSGGSGVLRFQIPRSMIVDR